MVYNIFLTDTITGNSIELDSADVDFSTAFQIADIKDLLIRRDVITKDLVFKFSDVNNKAFGAAFMTNRFINEAYNTPILGGNYNPQRIAPCVIYENGVEILKGNLRLKSVTQNTYECVVTGNVIEFTSLIGDATLSDIDLSDLTHTFGLAAIQASWTNAENYVYPVIQYGVPFKNPSDVGGINPYNILNFKPAIFVKSIFNRIFDDIGFKYEVRGNLSFLNIFNKLLIPDNKKGSVNSNFYDGVTHPLVINNDGFSYKTSSYNDAHQDGAQGWNGAMHMDIKVTKTDTLNLFNISGQQFGGGIDNQAYGKKTQVVFNATKTFTSTGIVEYSFGYVNNLFSQFPAERDIQCYVSLYERDVIPESNAEAFRQTDGWSTVAEEAFMLPSGEGTYISSFKIPSYTFKVGKQYRLSFTETTRGNADLSTGQHDYSIHYCVLSLPELATQSIDIEVSEGSQITPSLPTGIKQLDFINSIRAIFNLYVYTDPDNDKKIIFEPYDSYYSSASESNLLNNAKDWSSYIDYKGEYRNDSNLDIPKNYNFIWKQDKDYLNTFYQNKYNKSYADLQIADSRGITDKRDVNIIFSPTITSGSYDAKVPYFSLPVPYMYNVNGGDTEPIDTNIRLLIWNGLNVQPYTIVTELYNPVGGTWSNTSLSTSSFPLASNYLYGSNGLPEFDIHSGRPDEIFITKPSNFDSMVYSYSYYNNQINELKSGNVTFLTCGMYLNPDVINALNLKMPVFLDLGRNGTSYWKVLSVNYTNAETRSTVKLQKIV